MKEFFSSRCPTGPFILFSAPHISAIIVSVLSWIVLYFLRKQIASGKREKYFRFSLAIILILQEMLFQLWNITTKQWSIDYALPLQLCGISSILSAVMLVSKSCSIYEITYFWGIGGALQAIATPEIGAYTYPHFRYFQFFICHWAIITSNLYMTFIKGYRPKLKSVWKSLGVLNIYALLIFMFNKVTNSNYMFLNSKPEVSSIMDMLGPWPWYILSLEGVALVMFFILYIPFIILNYNDKSIEKKNTVTF